MSRCLSARLYFVIYLTVALMTQLGTAQVLSTLHSFGSTPGFESGTNIDGANPFGGLAMSGSTLFGTAQYGGGIGIGTLFRVNTDGNGFSVLHSFTGKTNSDGTTPMGALISLGNAVYGTTYGGGGAGGWGTVFGINTDGTGYNILHAFNHLDGGIPMGGVASSGNALYGTTYTGGPWMSGSVFAVNTDGSGFNSLYFFGGSPDVINDGGHPYGGLVLSGNRLYGTTSSGGDSGSGAVYALNTDGSLYTLLYSFTSAPTLPPYTNSDGVNPYSTLIVSGNTLFGTALYGGTYGGGTLFKLNTDGTGFTTLHSFSGGSDGTGPAGILLRGDTVYGTCAGGGLYGNGNVFSINTNGAGFSIVFSFGGSNGSEPLDALIASGGTFYGTTEFGGGSANGTVFSLSLLPQLALTLSGGTVVLAWPTNTAGFTLQSTTNLVSPVWTTNLPAPVVVNGQNTVTIPTPGTQQFFRLSQ